MNIVPQKHEILLPPGTSLSAYLIQQARQIEAAARVCYKSEGNATDASYEKMVRMLRDKDHSAMLEFGVLAVKFTTNRGVTHELVRHRIPSYAQESTRYCNYAKDKFNNELTFVRPPTWADMTPEQHGCWKRAMEFAERSYLEGIALGLAPQLARGMLPNDVKTEINVQCNFREWLHIFKLRMSPAAHPDIRLLLEPLKSELAEALPCVFG